MTRPLSRWLNPRFQTSGQGPTVQREIGALEWSMVTIILSLLLVDVFDAAGTLVGVATRGGLVGRGGRLPRLRGALYLVAVIFALKFAFL